MDTKTVHFRAVYLVDVCKLNINIYSPLSLVQFQSSKKKKLVLLAN